jgi:uncharacterized protein (TIGR03000 family)
MLHKAISLAGLLLLAGATVLVTPGSSQAQHRGGGSHFVGSHGGSFHGGGFRGGGFRHSSIRQGSFRHGSFHGGNFHHRGFHHDGFHHDGGRWWYPGYYGYYPYYGYYGYSPYSYDVPSYDWPSRAYDSGYYGSYEGVTPAYPDGYSPVTAQPDTSAHVTLSAPADAVIWFNDSKTTSTGSVREYHSPRLTPGIQYTYEIRARWNENGQEVTQTQQVKVTAGAHVSVKFPVQPTKAQTAPSH